jgi:hypothetical protein
LKPLDEFAPAASIFTKRLSWVGVKIKPNINRFWKIRKVVMTSVCLLFSPRQSPALPLKFVVESGRYHRTHRGTRASIPPGGSFALAPILSASSLHLGRFALGPTPLAIHGSGLQQKIRER